MYLYKNNLQKYIEIYVQKVSHFKLCLKVSQMALTFFLFTYHYQFISQCDIFFLNRSDMSFSGQSLPSSRGCWWTS